MSKVIYQLIYVLPLYYIVAIMILLLFLWIFLEHFFLTKNSKKFLWKMGNILVFIGMLYVIMAATISSRSQGKELILQPFHFFIEAQTQPEIYRSMLMNVFLFFPLGLALPYTLPQKWKHQALFAVVFAMLLSISIEYTQYYFSLGRAETDDVICNTLGCAIGTLAFVRGYKRDRGK